jgi:hypothetical protein
MRRRVWHAKTPVPHLCLKIDMYARLDTAATLHGCRWLAVEAWSLAVMLLSAQALRALESGLPR